MTYDEQKIHGPAVRARLPQIAAELTKITGKQWHAATRENTDEWHDLKTVDGWELYLSLPWGTKPGQMHIGATWPKSKDGTQFTMRGDDKVDGINISVSKTDAQIARDIARRIVPQYATAFDNLMARIKQHDEYQDRALVNATRVAAATGGHIVRDHHQPDRRQDEYHINLPNVYECRVSGSGVRLEIHGMSVDTAINMLAHFKADKDR